MSCLICGIWDLMSAWAIWIRDVLGRDFRVRSCNHTGPRRVATGGDETRVDPDEEDCWIARPAPYAARRNISALVIAVLGDRLTAD